jgi:hypothetical protein
MLAFQVGEQAGDLLGQARQAAQQPDHDTGRRGDRHPPPGRIGSITWLTHQGT